MHDGPIAGLLSVSIIFVPIVIGELIKKIKKNPSSKDERSTQQKYNIGWRENSSADTDEQLKNIS